MKLSDLNPNPENPRTISDEQLGRLKKSLEKFGDLSGFVFNKATGRLVGGHQRQRVLPPDAHVVVTETYAEPTATGTVAIGHVVIAKEKFNYREVSWDDTMEKTANIAANKHGGDFYLPKLSEWLLDLDHKNIDMDLTGFSRVELEDLMATSNLSKSQQARQKLSDRFLIPPFSVLNAREGWWQDRKRAWIDLGIQSEIGRGDTTPTGGGAEPLARFKSGQKSTWNNDRTTEQQNNRESGRPASRANKN